MRTIVFDLDGTLVSTPARRLWHETLSNHGQPAHIDAAYELGIGRAGIETIHELLGVGHPEVDALLAVYEQRLMATAPDEIDGAGELIAKLHDDGHRLVLSTGSPTAFAVGALDRSGWLDAFHLVLGSDQIPKSVRHYEVAAERLEITLSALAAESVAVGDGASEIRIAAELSVPVRIGYAPDSTTEAGLYAVGATHVVSTLNAVYSLCSDTV